MDNNLISTLNTNCEIKQFEPDYKLILISYYNKIIERTLNEYDDFDFMEQSLKIINEEMSKILNQLNMKIINIKEE